MHPNQCFIGQGILHRSFKGHPTQLIQRHDAATCAETSLANEKARQVVHTVVSRMVEHRPAVVPCKRETLVRANKRRDQTNSTNTHIPNGLSLREAPSADRGAGGHYARTREHAWVRLAGAHAETCAHMQRPVLLVLVPLRRRKRQGISRSPQRPTCSTSARQRDSFKARSAQL